MTRVFLVVQSSRERERLEEMLESAGMEVAGVAADLSYLAEELPGNIDVMIADFGDEPAAETLETINESGALGVTRVALLIGDVTPIFVNRALRAGVRGVLPPDVDAAQLSAAIRAIAQGLVVLYPSEQLLSRRVRVEEYAVEALTPREKEVLQMMGQGMSNKEIAARLRISEHTAKFHVASVLGKLGAATRAEAVSIAMRRGLILL